MMRMKSIVLIGMPGSGKSTLGVLLAKELMLDFVDTDLLIQNRERKTLQQIVDGQGYLRLREIEAEVIQENSYANTLVATGGSVVYSDAGMRHLQGFGRVVFLKVGLDTLNARVNNKSSRGLAAPQGHTLQNIFDERQPLYERYAEVTVDANGQSVDDTLASVLKALRAQL